MEHLKKFLFSLDSVESSNFEGAMKATQEEEFEAFENKVDEVMQILTLMTADDTKANRDGIELANKWVNSLIVTIFLLFENRHKNI